MIFNSELVREIFYAALKEKKLTIADVERRVGLTRLSLRNFMDAKAKEPRADMLLFVAKYLEIDLHYLVEVASFDSSVDKTFVLRPSGYANPPCDGYLFQTCVDHVLCAAQARQLVLSLDQVITIVKQIYRYCQQYTQGKFDESFVNWQLDHLKK